MWPSKMRLRMLKSYSQVLGLSPAPLLTQLPVTARLGPCCHTRDLDVFQVPASAWPRPSCVGIWEVKQRTEGLFLCLSSKLINN